MESGYEKLLPSTESNSIRSSMNSSTDEHIYDNLVTFRSDVKLQKTTAESTDTGEPIVVVAIDFGTTFTGYAFSFRHSKDTILTSTHGGMLEQDRVPTAILLNPDLTFKAFGNEAKRQYGNLPIAERDCYFYLGHFKMALYCTRQLSRHSKIKDIKGREVIAIDVFAMSLKYLYGMALEIIRQKSTDVEEKDIQWILTIPAIWADSARQFMREAANKADISAERLRLVLEPEAASVFCQEYRLTVHQDSSTLLSRGHKYILADLGGGTADICVHEVLGDRKLKELYRATGGDLGGHSVTTNYFAFLEELFGKKVLNKFIENNTGPYFDMVKDFERKKKTFSMTNTEPIVLSLEVALLQILRKKSKKTLAKRISKSQYRDEVTYQEATGRLVINRTVIERFFLYAVNGILDKLQEILAACEDDHIQTLMVVGGFAESPYLRERITQAFPNLNLIIHDETRLAVLKGAVMLGFSPLKIVQRRSQFTYGFSCWVPYIEGKHPEALKETIDGEHRCMHIFVKMIEVGQTIEVGNTFTMKGYNTTKDYNERHIIRTTQLWRSTRRNPVYCLHEPGQDNCEPVGRIDHRPPAEGWPDYMEGEQQLIVGETEFTVRYVDKKTGDEYDARVDFL